jgi:uncharacterized protein YdhG (YjbR/CyaY superfamily)
MPSETIKKYIAAEPASVQRFLRQIYRAVRKGAPKATEKLAWGMPTLFQEGNLLHFAAFKNHASLFPGSDAIVHFKKALSRFETSKGTIQFPFSEKLPVALITQIANYCVKRNVAKAAARKAKSRVRRPKNR